MNKTPEERTILTFSGDGSFQLESESIPELDDGMVLVEVYASLVSPGSELGGGWSVVKSLHESPEDRPPKRIGYSNTGIVLSVGPGVRHLQPGQRVACVGAGKALHATHACVPQNLVVPLPDNVTFEEGSYAMLLATGLQGLRRTKAEFGEYVAVAGLGMVGLITSRIFSLAGCRVIGWDTIDKRLQIARSLGIAHSINVLEKDAVQVTQDFTENHGLDHGILALGGNAEKPYDDLVAGMKVSPDGHAMGNLLIIGGAHFPYKKNLSNLNIIRSSRTGPGYHDKAWERGADYPPVFVRWHTRNNLELCLELIAEGKIDVNLMTTHVVPFEEAEGLKPKIMESPDEFLGLVFVMKK